MAIYAKGEPYIPSSLVLTIGDPNASDASDALRGVVVTEVTPGTPPGNITNQNVFLPEINVSTWIQLTGNPAFFPPVNLAIQGAKIWHYFHNLEGGPMIVVGPQAITAAGAPTGDAAPAPGESDLWYNANANNINLAKGTYKVLTVLKHPMGVVSAFHDDTYVVID